MIGCRKKVWRCVLGTQSLDSAGSEAWLQAAILALADVFDGDGARIRSLRLRRCMEFRSNLCAGNDGGQSRGISEAN